MSRGVLNKQTANGRTITKTDAVRRALAELGRDAKPTEIREWIKGKFKIDVGPNSISALKTMLNKQKPPRSKPTDGETGISKLEGVRRALAKFGEDAKPQDIQRFLKESFGIEMGTVLISNYKSHLSRKAAGKSAVIRKPSARTAAASVSPGFTLDEIQTVRQVVEQIGADKVQQLASVLAQ